ncbi:uncharacterized protein LOC116297473 [Actinia tenebrosa]|uniref:Uncharacterized protein LOC116297473 n=1 Tax=Actinia tenebrosa TaxID=6105 RepID=A0A6P8IA35_ACTTE|nr:uncharacterized protein LOC116297473 [Actinia tenebrosa]
MVWKAMGHGVTKHSKPTMKDGLQFHDLSQQNSEVVPNMIEECQDHTREREQNILLQIRNAVCWPEKFDSKHIGELKDLIRQLFETATREMTALATEKKYSQVEEIVQAIIKLASQWGEEFLASLDLDSFIREVITIEVKGIEYTINVGEYFKARPFYSRDNRLVIFYFFLVSESISKNKIMSYYLECSNIIQRFFVLGLSVSGSHLRVCSFDRCCPSYWVVREAVLQDMKVRINASLHVKRETTSQQDERELYEDLREGIIV